MSRETWELLSYVVTVIGLPMAIAVFVYEQRKDFRSALDEQLRGEDPYFVGYLRKLAGESHTRN